MKLVANRRKGNYSEALNQINRLRIIDENRRAVYHIEYAYVLIGLGRYEEAIENINHAIPLLDKQAKRRWADACHLMWYIEWLLGIIPVQDRSRRDNIAAISHKTSELRERWNARKAKEENICRHYLRNYYFF